MTSPPGQTKSHPAELQSPPIENVLATVLYGSLSGITFYDSAPLATFCTEYLQVTTYEKPHFTINVLYVVLCAFVINCENRE